MNKLRILGSFPLEPLVHAVRHGRRLSGAVGNLALDRHPQPGPLAVPLAVPRQPGGGCQPRDAVDDRQFHHDRDRRDLFHDPGDDDAGREPVFQPGAAEFHAQPRHPVPSARSWACSPTAS